MRTFFALVALGLVVLFCSAFLNQRQGLLLTNAQILNPRTQKVVRGHILIRGEKIHSILKEMPLIPYGEMVDLGNQYVIPGLIDAHIHPGAQSRVTGRYDFFSFSETMNRNLQAGVVAGLDLFSNEATNFLYRKNQDKQNNADFFTSGSCLTATRGHCTEYGIPTRTMDNPEQARAVVRSLVSAGAPDVVKIVYDDVIAEITDGQMPTINEPTMKAAVETAQTLGYKTVIHIGSWDNARKAIWAGATALTHVHGEPIPSDVIALMKIKGVYLIPTLVMQTELVSLQSNPNIWRDELAARLVQRDVYEEYKDPKRYSEFTKYWLKWQQEGAATSINNVGRAYRAGVKIVTGTDVANLGVFHGYSVHREMDLFKTAGMKEWDILKAATIEAADFLGKNYGLDPGNLASLIVLKESPLKDIANTKKISRVMHRGRFVPLRSLN